jgi:hypothetical protein
LLIVLEESKFCAAEFTIDTNCGQSPTPSIVIFANDGEILRRKIVGSKNEGEKLRLLLRRCPKHSAACTDCSATLPMRAAHELQHSERRRPRTPTSHSRSTMRQTLTVLDFLEARKSDSSFPPEFELGTERELKVGMEI